MKPSDVATIINVSPVTVRAWSTEFAQWMSPTGAGGDGRHRDFTDTDIKVLFYIKTQKASGRNPDEIAAALTSMQGAGEFNNLPLPNENYHAEMPVLPAAVVDETRRALMRENAMLQERINQLESKLEAQQADRERLLRELGDIRADLKVAETLLDLYKTSKLKPDE
jgi:DNA-binding transcriptional MerR regulator